MLTQAITLIMSLEGFSGTAYKDTYQNTVGYGTKAILKDVCITKAWAMERLQEVVEKHINNTYSEELTSSQLAALTSFSYNVGVNAYKKSKVAKHVANGDLCKAAEELSNWVYAKGNKLEGLVKRREIEKTLLIGDVKC